VPEAVIGNILGDAITIKSNRVVASVFDGDPQPIFDAILDAYADELVRSHMCEAPSYWTCWTRSRAEGHATSFAIVSRASAPRSACDASLR
jgi:hypothetical protein